MFVLSYTVVSTVTNPLCDLIGVSIFLLQLLTAVKPDCDVQLLTHWSLYWFMIKS